MIGNIRRLIGCLPSCTIVTVLCLLMASQPGRLSAMENDPLVRCLSGLKSFHLSSAPYPQGCDPSDPKNPTSLSDYYATQPIDEEMTLQIQAGSAWGFDYQTPAGEHAFFINKQQEASRVFLTQGVNRDHDSVKVTNTVEEPDLSDKSYLFLSRQYGNILYYVAGGGTGLGYALNHDPVWVFEGATGNLRIQVGMCEVGLWAKANNVDKVFLAHHHVVPGDGDRYRIVNDSDPSGAADVLRQALLQRGADVVHRIARICEGSERTAAIAPTPAAPPAASPNASPTPITRLTRSEADEAVIEAHEKCVQTEHLIQQVASEAEASQHKADEAKQRLQETNELLRATVTLVEQFLEAPPTTLEDPAFTAWLNTLPQVQMGKPPFPEVIVVSRGRANLARHEQPDDVQALVERYLHGSIDAGGLVQEMIKRHSASDPLLTLARRREIADRISACREGSTKSWSEEDKYSTQHAKALERGKYLAQTLQEQRAELAQAQQRRNALGDGP